MKKFRVRVLLRVTGPGGWRERVQARFLESRTARKCGVTIAWTDALTEEPPSFELDGRLSPRNRTALVELLLMAFAEVAWQEGALLGWSEC